MCGIYAKDRLHTCQKPRIESSSTAILCIGKELVDAHYPNYRFHKIAEGREYTENQEDKNQETEQQLYSRAQFNFTISRKEFSLQTQEPFSCLIPSIHGWHSGGVGALQCRIRS